MIRTGGEGVLKGHSNAIGFKKDLYFVLRPATGLAAVRHAEGVGTGFGDLGEKFGGGEVVGAGPLVGDVGAGGGGGRKVALNFEADGTYTASNVADGRDVVWPTSGTWDFKSDDELNTVIRGDDVSISIVVDEANLKMTFNYTANGGRTNGTDGVWVFNMQTN